MPEATATFKRKKKNDSVVTVVNLLSMFYILGKVSY